MKKNLLFLAMLTILGCGKEAKPSEGPTPEPQPITISLENNEITLICGETRTIAVSGTTSYCSAEEGDEFIAWASGGNGKIEVEGQHVGTTSIKITCDEAINEETCLITVLPTIDYIGSVSALFGKSRSEVKEGLDKSYTDAYTDSQRGCVTYMYNKSGYYIANRYYYDSDDKLCGIHKSIESPNDTETFAYINISNSLNEYMEYVSGSLSSGRAYQHPDGYYAVLFSPTKNSKHDVFYASTYDEAKNHTFVKYL